MSILPCECGVVNMVNRYDVAMMRSTYFFTVMRLGAAEWSLCSDQTCYEIEAHALFI